jgi:hypothetical protein
MCKLPWFVEEEFLEFSAAPSAEKSRLATDIHNIMVVAATEKPKTTGEWQMSLLEETAALRGEVSVSS